MGTVKEQDSHFSGRVHGGFGRGGQGYEQGHGEKGLLDFFLSK